MFRIYVGHRHRISGEVVETTNNRMELTAVIEGLKRLTEPCEADIYSDSAYTVNAFVNGWVYDWARSDWVKADNKPLLNSDLWQELFALSKKHKLNFIKVKGHADNEYNNICDKLATDAIKNYKSQL